MQAVIFYYLGLEPWLGLRQPLPVGLLVDGGEPAEGGARVGGQVPVQEALARSLADRARRHDEIPARIRSEQRFGP